MAVALMGCEGEEQYSTKYQCSFVFYARYHTDCALTHALGNPGLFVIVEPKFVAGVTHLRLTPNQGQWEEFQTDISMGTSAIENERINYGNMGANRRLIIGCSNFDGLRCYDGQCPNCLENASSVNFPLTWTDRGQMLECSKCKTKYNPNAMGNAVNGNAQTKRLIEYRVEPFNGDRLYVHN